MSTRGKSSEGLSSPKKFDRGSPFVTKSQKTKTTQPLLSAIIQKLQAVRNRKYETSLIPPSLQRLYFRSQVRFPALCNFFKHPWPQVIANNVITANLKCSTYVVRLQRVFRRLHLFRAETCLSKISFLRLKYSNVNLSILFVLVFETLRIKHCFQYHIYYFVVYKCN